MERFRLKSNPEVPTVEAVRLTKENVNQVADWCTGKEVEEIDALEPDIKYVGLNLLTPTGWARASEGDYVVRDNIWGFYVRWPAEFEANFERVE